MPLGKLTVSKVRQTLEPGRYGDGGCLYLVVAPGGSKHWVARLTIHGRQTDMGLGGVSYVTLAEAREKAAQLRKIARAGGDPRTERKREQITFSEAARRVHANLLPTWKNEKHAQTWLSSVERHAFPVFGERPIEKVTTADCLLVLSPIWTRKPETAKRLKQRLGTIFDWAKGAGHYPHENPVNGLKKALPQIKRRPVHMATIGWQRVPDFMAALADREGVSARTLEFIILTAARSGEVRGARWCEIDDRVWIVPGERMKRGLPHKVPLSAQAIHVLGRVHGLHEDLVFPSRVPGKDGFAREQSVMVFKALLGRMGFEGFTVHGFRSAFRDWCSEALHAPREVAEAALSHAIGDAVERAYARSDLFDRRKQVMQEWANYACNLRTDF